MGWCVTLSKEDCVVDYCRNTVTYYPVLGLCNNHYARKRYGGVSWNQKSQYEKTEQERFWEKVDMAGPVPVGRPELGCCWLWTGCKFKTGIPGVFYGGFSSKEFGSTSTTAHRVSFFWEAGVVSTVDNPLDHLCRVTLCVRPSHLEQVTFAENVLRGTGPTAVNKVKTHCIHGHEFTAENTTSNAGGRKCRECHRRISREWAARNKKGVTK